MTLLRPALDTSGGIASKPAWKRGGLTSDLTTIADAWSPPSPMALPEQLCQLAIEVASASPPITAETAALGSPWCGPGVRAWVLQAPGSRFPQMRQTTADAPPALLAAAVARSAAANAAWWDFDLDAWSVVVKRYESGTEHPPHMDWSPSAETAPRKIASTMQLSAPDDYAGGDLSIRTPSGTMAIPMSRERGTVIVFPSWTTHAVLPITAGVRWSLIVNGWGPRLR